MNQKEQKPAEWSEEDEQVIQNACDFLVNYENSLRNGGNHGKADKVFNAVKNLKSLRPQPKQEWSKEDETKLNDVIRIIENDCGLVESIRSHYVNFLKSLPEKFDLQPKREWSKEDETISNRIQLSLFGYACAQGAPTLFDGETAWLEELPNRFPLKPKSEWSYKDNNRFDYLLHLIKESGENEATKKGLTGFVNRIRSLGPQQWKPTDEQYEALRDATIKLDADDSDARFPWEGLPVLHSLLNDLFELRKK